MSKVPQSINKAGRFVWWHYLSNQWSFGTRSRGAEQRFGEPLLLREGSQHAAAAGKCARSWTATQQWKSQSSLRNAELDSNHFRFKTKHHSKFLNECLSWCRVSGWCLPWWDLLLAGRNEEFLSLLPADPVQQLTIFTYWHNLQWIWWVQLWENFPVTWQYCKAKVKSK